MIYQNKILTFARRNAYSHHCMRIMLRFRRLLMLLPLIIVSQNFPALETDTRQAAADRCSENPPASSVNRGVSYHYCGWDFTGGAADLEAMAPRLAWTYNWSSRPVDCPDGKGVGDHKAFRDGTVEFVPMVWGLVDAGNACDSGGPCFRIDARDGGAACKKVCRDGEGKFDPDGECWPCYHQAVSRDGFLKDVPAGAPHLPGYNEPNFKEQADLTPD